MHDWLIKHKFSHKKPKGVPAKFNKLRQEAFIREYEELKANIESGEVVLFIDSVHTLIKRQKLPLVGLKKA